MQCNAMQCNQCNAVHRMTTHNSALQVAPEALPALGGGDVPQASAVVKAAAGHKVAQVVESHPPHSLGVVTVGGHTALLLKAPKLHTCIAGA